MRASTPTPSPRRQSARPPVPPPARRARPAAVSALLLGSLLLGTACREGEEQRASGFVPLVPPTAGNHGCATANQVFTGNLGTLLVDLGGFTLAAESRVAADADEPLLFVTGANGSLLEVDVTDANAPSTRTLLNPGTVAALLATAGIGAAPVLSGVAVLDDSNLVVVEHTSNTLLLVSRVVVDSPSFLAGLPSTTGGFADGLGTQARFAFGAPTTLVPTAAGQLYVADSGNHAIRQVTLGVVPQVLTVAGTGAPGYADGDLDGALFDTPTGLSIACGGQLLVTETGAAGLGGHRLRSLAIGTPTFFGGFAGNASTLAGDGTEASVAGIGDQASLAAPSAVFSTAEGEVYFVDAATGHARRYAVTTGEVDCPFEVAGCTLGSGSFAGEENVGLTVASNGELYVVLGSQDQLLRVSQL